MKLVLIYGGLALIAIAANIGAQDAFLWAFPGTPEMLVSVAFGTKDASWLNIKLPIPDMVIPMAVGTGVGLVVKYILDKRFVFRFTARNAQHDGQTFLLYTIMGLATTVIAWGFELEFEELFRSREMSLVGGAIGLVIGYFAKYHLDKRFVFRTKKQRELYLPGDV